jgi:hypothetical protein
MDVKYMQDLLFELGHVMRAKDARAIAAKVRALHATAVSAQLQAGDRRHSIAFTSARGELMTTIHYYDFAVWWFYNKIPPRTLTPVLRLVRTKLKLRQRARHKVARKHGILIVQ